jgi:glyoxylase-like metal-dependent hydrolase (beta-lactamase superfamily II)
LRALGLHADVIVLVSRIWRTTCTAVRSGEEGFVIDSPVLPDELDALPGVLEQIGFPVSGLLATHGDWDHLLGRLAFPGASLGSSEATVERLAASPGAAQRELRAFDDEHYVARPEPLSLRGLQALPVPGRCAVGSMADRELALLAGDGHTADGMAIWIPWARVLVCGDYLSPVEIPMISSEGGSVDAYLATLERLRPFVSEAETVVPGHGEPMGVEAALAVLAEDEAYLGGLAVGDRAVDLPRGRQTSAQRRIHERNVARMGQLG